MDSEDQLGSCPGAALIDEGLTARFIVNKGDNDSLTSFIYPELPGRYLKWY
ncbi:unnamed protein product [marine sediment metagenome]|uniref:Uncharacterized protein n=1 Tax=marine sediment metagenome TaxID=412755 RepID=X1BLT5_9ZZZZ